MANNFDEAELLDRVDNDVAFLTETVSMLTVESPPLLEQVRTAVSAGDAAAVARHAHALKGMIANFCAAQAHAAAQRVEQFGKSGDLTAAPAAVQTLHDDLDSLTQELLKFVKAKS